MSIEIYGSCFSQGQAVGIPVALVRNAFAALVAEVRPGSFMLSLEPDAGVLTALHLQTDGEETHSFMVARPVHDLRLYDSLLQVLRQKGMVVYAPGSQAAVAHPETPSHLPIELTQSLGGAVLVASAKALQDVLFSG